MAVRFSFIAKKAKQDTLAVRYTGSLDAMKFKFGAHIFLWTDRWTDDQLRLMDRARGLGLECLEIAIGDDVKIDGPRLRKHAGDLGMELILSPGAMWPVECDISDDDPANAQRGLDWHRRAIDLCGESGAVAYCGAIYGHPGTVRRRRMPAEELGRTAENLHRLAGYAESAGVKVVLEPMSHFRSHVVNTPAQAMRLIEGAGHRNLFVLLDTYHLVTEIRDYAQAVRCVESRLWGVHACENDRGVPGGGLVPWEELFGALNRIEREGYMLLETYNSSLGDFAVSRGMFHDVCPDGDEFVRRGAGFLRGMGW